MSSKSREIIVQTDNKMKYHTYFMLKSLKHYYPDHPPVRLMTFGNVNASFLDELAEYKQNAASKWAYVYKLSFPLLSKAEQILYIDSDILFTSSPEKHWGVLNYCDYASDRDYSLHPSANKMYNSGVFFANNNTNIKKAFLAALKNMERKSLTVDIDEPYMCEQLERHDIKTGDLEIQSPLFQDDRPEVCCVHFIGQFKYTNIYIKEILERKETEGYDKNVVLSFLEDLNKVSFDEAKRQVLDYSPSISPFWLNLRNPYEE